MSVFRHFLLIAGLLAAATCASAASVRANGSSIYVNEVEVVKIRASAAGRSPAERAAYLAPLLAADLAKGGVRIAAAGKECRIVVGGKPWMLVTRDEAKAAGTTPKALAGAWSAAIASAAALPPLKLSVRQVKAPVGGSRSVSLVGSQVQNSTVRSSDEKIFKVVRTGATVAIEGVSPGSGQAQIAAGANATTLDVTVQPVAAYFPQSLTAYVTGTPATRDMVAGALVASVNSDLKTVDGAQAGFAPPSVTEIGTGESRCYAVRVKVSGPMAFPSEGVVNVTVKNSPIGYREETELWYSNNPEPVKKPMRLFVGGLKAGQPVRMLYHHINRTGSTLIMNVEAINNTNTPARMLIIPGDAEPAQNPVVAGFEAADRFVRSWSKYSGEIVDIPPYSILPISLRRMRRNDTVSGLCYLRLLEGGPQELIVRAEARSPSVVDHKWKAAMASATPWRIAGTKPIGDLASVPMPDSVHIYPNPFKEEDVDYTVGGPFGFVRIGQTPIARQDNQGALDGNFGVLYTITANIQNKTANPADVEVVYEASAGYGGAVFLIDGSVRKTPMLQPKEETRLSRFRLEPYSSKSLKILTVPLSGSAYPCTITIRPVQPPERNNHSGKS
ncbi:MAG TPA: hypothetical protein VG820_00510 [Fimbriimonadaceae bacterium]|nr:hypothetical protein [Fimbriimonadaceae bacterium]